MCVQEEHFGESCAFPQCHPHLVVPIFQVVSWVKKAVEPWLNTCLLGGKHKKVEQKRGTKSSTPVFCPPVNDISQKPVSVLPSTPSCRRGWETQPFSWPWCSSASISVSVCEKRRQWQTPKDFCSSLRLIKDENLVFGGRCYHLSRFPCSLKTKAGHQMPTLP